ncbi:hypothetical protein DCAR_0105077 [Daucus carota subsp. sativus]|uniref:Uncharacterized protein n=1 Tax=Daucus carota subsp. sativus TaxID=79200 RepID=A0A166JCD2_DAUCS|nr:PREDICTED: protein IQ-DOMAIN 14-like [Daucus carota subsp. sativus]WOG85884.1 hypothetical protein DCAR_0105077 [Daucus carota subsp. sativus]
MGKAAKWFRSLFGLKRPNNITITTPCTDAKRTPSRRWSFKRSTSNRYHTLSDSIVSALPRVHLKGDKEQKHMIAAAVKNMSELKGNCDHWAAVKIQAHFRGFLARKALRALRGLVKLQALVRGHIVRKQIAGRLLQMQAALRARTRARALRAQIYEAPQSTIKPSHIHHLGPATPENSEHDIRRSRSSKYEQSVMLEKNGSITASKVGPDKGKLNVRYSTDGESQDRVYLQDSTYHQAYFYPLSGEEQSLSPLKYTIDVDEAFCAAETSLHVNTSRRASFTRSGPFTPRSDISKSSKSGYSDNSPSYMSYTASSKAKVRSPSLSAPHQKTLERSNTTKRLPINGGYGNMKSSSVHNVPSTLHSKFVSKAYPGSGRLDRLGSPLGSNGVAFSCGLLSSY